MTEDEFDVRLAVQFGNYARTKSLPKDFSDRLVGAVRRRRRIRRAGLLAVILVLVLTSVGLVGTLERGTPDQSHATTLVAANGGQSRPEKVSGIFFLGFIQGCFNRMRNSRKKEEENQ